MNQTHLPHIHVVKSKLRQLSNLIISNLPPPTLKNLWLTLSSVVIIQNLIVFTNSQITGNAITALIVWGGAIICMEDQIEILRPKPTNLGLTIGIVLTLYSLYRTSRVVASDSFLYLLVPVTGLGLLLLAEPIKNLLRYKDSLIVLCLLPAFLIFQVLFSTYATRNLSLLTAKFVLFWLGFLGIQPVKLVEDTVFVGNGAVQVMHECNGFEMIMQLVITSIIFLLAFPLRSRIGKLVIIIVSPIIGFIVNSLRITLLSICTSFNTQAGTILFDFFHEQAGSLIFSGVAVFLLGYLYLAILNRELPPLNNA